MSRPEEKLDRNQPVVIVDKLPGKVGFLAKGPKGDPEFFLGADAQILEMLITSRRSLTPISLEDIILIQKMKTKTAVEDLRSKATESLSRIEDRLSTMGNVIHRIQVITKLTPEGELDDMRYLLASEDEDLKILTEAGRRLVEPKRFEGAIFSGPPLADEFIKEITQRYINEGLYDPEASVVPKPSEVSFKSLISVVASSLDYPSPVAEKCLALLGQDLDRYKPKDVLKDLPETVEWAKRMGSGLAALDMIGLRQGVDQGLSTPSQNLFYKSVESQVKLFSEAIDRLGWEDRAVIVAMLGLPYSSFRSPDEIASPPAMKMSGRIKGKLQGFEVNSDIFGLGREIGENMDRSIIGAWARISQNLDWEQTQELVTLIPKMGWERCRREIVAATFHASHELYSKNGSFRLSEERCESLARGLVSMLLYQSNELPETHFGRSSKLNQERAPSNQEHGFLDVHRELPVNSDLKSPVGDGPFPAALVFLISATRKSSDLKMFGRILIKMGEVVSGNEQLSNDWLVTLVALSHCRTELRTCADGLIQSISGLSSECKAVLADQAPGFVYLLPNGKLAVYDNPSTSSKVRRIYKSEYVKPDVVETEEEVAQTEEPQIKISKVVEFPFIGKMGVIGEREEVEKVLEKVFTLGPELDWDALLSDFERLKRVIRVRASFTTRPMLCISSLNKHDPVFAEAAFRGIDSIYLSDNLVRFSIPGLSEEQRALEGQIQANGELELLGMDSSFIGEPAQLYLNNLALHALARPIKVAGADSVYDKGLSREINAVASGWNRFERGSLPKLGFVPAKESDLVLPITPEPNVSPAALIQVK